MPKIKKIPLSSIIPNDENPRYISDEKFEKLVKSIEQFGNKMMPLRPMVIDENNILLGGNMRYKAIEHLGIKDIPENWVKKVDDLTEDEKKEFIVKDNVGFGSWDWEKLANEWNAEDLDEWGLDIPELVGSDVDLDDFFEQDGDNSESSKNKIVLDYTEDDYNEVMEALNALEGSKEQIIYNLLLGDE